MRIVTLLPSATEIVCLLGLQDQLVGVSHECDFPALVNELPRVTSALIPATATSKQIDEQVRAQLQSQQPLYALDVGLLENLQPDLIITQDLCSVCAVATGDLQQVAQRLPSATQFLTLEPLSLADVLQSILQVAEVTNAVPVGRQQVSSLTQRIDQVTKRASQSSARPTAIFLEWLDPPFSAGHWIPEIEALAGVIELIGVPGQPSRTITWGQVALADPDMLILACCGYSAERTREDMQALAGHDHWQSLRAVRERRVIVLDGNAHFSRPGPRLVDGLEILARQLHS